MAETVVEDMQQLVIDACRAGHKVVITCPSSWSIGRQLHVAKVFREFLESGRPIVIACDDIKITVIPCGDPPNGNPDR